jgi:hypothetical protein
MEYHNKTEREEEAKWQKTRENIIRQFTNEYECLQGIKTDCLKAMPVSDTEETDKNIPSG